MSKFYSLRMGVGFFLLLSLYPDQRLQNQRVRSISKSLVISTSKSTPPRRAFEEVLRLSSEELVAAKPQAVPGVNLNSHLAENKLPPISTLFNRRVHLNAMVITRTEALGANREQAELRLPIRGLASLPPDTRPYSTKGVSENDLADDWYASLSPRQKRLLEASGVADTDLQADEKPVSLAEALAEKVDEELATMGQVTKLASRTSPAQGENSAAPFGNLEVPSGNFKVAGHIYLDDKTPLLPNHHIEVHWMREGVAKKTQVVPQTESGFAMDVTELVGQIRAEMYNDSSGQVVAAGSLRLSSELPATALKNAQLRLQPTRSVVARYTDFYRQESLLMASSSKRGQAKPRGEIQAKASFDDQTHFSPDVEGTLFIDGVSTLSSAFAYTESKDYYPAIHMVTAGLGEDALPLLPTKTATALLQIIEEQLGYSSLPKNGALILGQVAFDGQPLQGVKVQVEGADNLQPVYLNEILIPDPKLTETTSSGYFVLAHPTEGYYSFRAEKAGRFVGFGNTTAEAGTSAFVKIEHASSSAPFELRAFNAFNGDGVVTQVSLQASDQVFDIDSYGLIKHPIVKGQAVAQIEPTNIEYLPSLFPYDGKDDHLYMPLLKKAWMDELVGRTRLNLEPNTGMIVGFTHKGGFEISLPHLNESAHVRVIYFDAQGLETPAPVDQGGFILVNVPNMVQTIVLTDAMGQVLSQVMPIDSGWITTARFDL